MVKLDSIKGIGILGITDVVRNASVGVFWLYIASILEPDEFGEISYFISMASICAIFTGIGTQNVITIYAAKKIDVLKTLTIISLATSIIGSVILLLLFERIDIGILSIGLILNNLAIGHILGKKDFTSYSKFMFIQKGLTIGLGLIAISFFNYEGLIFAIGFSYLFFIIRIIKIFRESKIDFSLLRTKWRFVLDNYLMILIGSLINQLDKILIMPMLGFVILGNYSLTIQFMVILNSLGAIVFKFILPNDSTNTSTRNIKKFLVFASVGISLFGFFVLPQIIPIFFPKYIDAIIAIQILSLQVVPSSIFIILTSKLLSLEKSKYLLISYGISLTILVIGIVILGPIYGIVGLTSAYVISSVANVIFTGFCYKRFLNEKIDEKI